MNNPNHVAIIMDGNQRWAIANHLKTEDGHKAGAENALRIIQQAIKLHVNYLSLYVFSSENLQRPKEEVSNIISLMNDYALNKFNSAYEEDAKIKFIGDLSFLDSITRSNLQKVEEYSSVNSSICVNIMLCYGSRAEIVRACSKIINQHKKSEEITEEIFASNLYHDIPDVDLLIRTGDKMRISNFLLWQSAYAELYFSKKMWPEFSVEDFEKAIGEYSKRVRTFGKR